MRFARVCLGQVNPKFKIHPDNITSENWKETVVNMIDAIIQVTHGQIINCEPDYSTRQAIRHAIKYGLGIEISKEEGEELRISSAKPKPKTSRFLCL